MKKDNYFWGIVFIIAAIFVIVNQLNIFPEIHMMQVLGTVICLAIIVKSIPRMNFAGILFPLAFLCILFADVLNIRNLTPWPVLLTACLGSIGLSMIFHKKFSWHSHTDFSKKEGHKKEKFDDIIDEKDDNIVECNVSFGSIIKYVNSNNFERADIKCSFAALKIYFDGAKMQGNHAVINLDVSFGGAEIYIPKEWHVINEVNVSLGGVNEKGKTNTSGYPEVLIKGNVSLSGVEIYYI